MNLENLKYIHVYKFNTEQTNMAKLIKKRNNIPKITT
jgi:hypothetical protein